VVKMEGYHTDSVQEQMSTTEGQTEVRKKVTDKYVLEQEIAQALEIEKGELTTAIIKRSSPDNELAEDVLDWLTQSRDLLSKHLGTVTETDLQIFDSAIETLNGGRDAQTAEEQLNYIKPLFQRLYRELGWTSTSVPQQTPFREDNKQRLLADRKVADAGGKGKAVQS